jgi:methylphosphotriester-DNA--protein-cysteine methyltransferase
VIDSRAQTKSNGPDSGPDKTWHRAVDTRDRSFDGTFFVAITTTRIYCRPICPSRLARPENRRFFLSRADAEESGYRACRRCRPELAPGQAPVDVAPPDGNARPDHVRRLCEWIPELAPIQRRLPAGVPAVANGVAAAIAARVNT